MSMDQQEAVHTPFEDIKNVASELLERHCNNLMTDTSESTSNFSKKSLKPITKSGVIKHYGRRMKLNCRHGYNILIFDNGTVDTSDDDIDKHCILEFTSMAPGHVRIKGVEANLFLAMDKTGHLYGEPDPTKKSTIFIEQSEGPYSAYLSFKYQKKKWYVAIKKNGKIKSGTETRRGQHATHFLPVPINTKH